MDEVLGMPSKVDPGMSILVPPWTMNWVTLLVSKRVTTLGRRVWG